MPSDDDARTAKDAANRVKEAAKSATDAVKNGAQAVSGAMDGAVDLVGGYNGIDKMSFLSKFGLTDRPSKFVIFLIGVGVIQTIFPVLGFFLGMYAKFLGIFFVFNNGKKELVAGFKRSASAMKVKSMMVSFLICSAFDLIPTFLFDTYYHFGALWGFILPVLLSITPFEDQPGQTIANIICDVFYSPFASVIEGLVPKSLTVSFGNKTRADIREIWERACWIGYIGATGSFIVVWCYLSYQTALAVGSPIQSSDSSRYIPQMTEWHNLLAIWLWRYLISAIESIEIPGLVSVVGVIVYYVPTYFIWVTAFMFGMLITRKTEKRMRADTWYARWIIGGTGDVVKSASEDQPSKDSRRR